MPEFIRKTRYSGTAWQVCSHYLFLFIFDYNLNCESTSNEITQILAFSLTTHRHNFLKDYINIITACKICRRTVFTRLCVAVELRRNSTDATVETLRVFVDSRYHIIQSLAAATDSSINTSHVLYRGK